MKLLFTAVAFGTGLLAGGCAEDTPPAEVVREHFQTGLSGQGQLGPINRQDDPFVGSRGGDPAPEHP